jgi:hypothetical protein
VNYDLAQVNIALLADDLESPRLADFVNALDPVNAEADIAPGFVWRLQTEDGNAIYSRDNCPVIASMAVSGAGPMAQHVGVPSAT